MGLNSAFRSFALAGLSGLFLAGCQTTQLELSAKGRNTLERAGFGRGGALQIGALPMGASAQVAYLCPASRCGEDVHLLLLKGTVWHSVPISVQSAIQQGMINAAEMQELVAKNNRIKVTNARVDQARAAIIMDLVCESPSCPKTYYIQFNMRFSEDQGRGYAVVSTSRSLAARYAALGFVE